MEEQNKNIEETKATEATQEPKAEPKKVSIRDIIAKKRGPLEEKTATVYVPSLDGEIVIKTPSRDDLRQYDHTMVYEYGKTEDEQILQQAFERLVLRNVVEPNLKDSELIEAMGCKTRPSDIVKEVFDTPEIPQIALCILKLAGRNSTKPVRLVAEIKN
jgi:hypothetical protein